MLVIGIAGGAGSGKTTVVRKILQSIDPQDVAVLSQDAYYRDSSDVPPQERQRINVDHPDSIEFELLARHVAALKRGEAVEEPTYSYTTYQRGKETVYVEPRPVILVEGILVLQNEALRKLMDLKVYVETDDDDRLARVIRRDIVERGRTATMVLDRYETIVKPMHKQFIEPSRKYADLIIPNYVGGCHQCPADRHRKKTRKRPRSPILICVPRKKPSDPLPTAIRRSNERPPTFCGTN